MTTMTWKVGPLAVASGLTVRTLHHWDSIGLLSPSQRTPAGHREYTEDDLGRLYLILTLRRLGLGLESIATCLDVGVDPVRLVRDHQAAVERSVASLEALLVRLRRVSDQLGSGGKPQTQTLLEVLGSMSGPGPEALDALREHLDEDQIQLLTTRSATLGPALHYLLEIEWPELYRQAETLRQSGADPGSPEVRRLVGRMDELSVMFSGGDGSISQGVRTAWKENPAAMSAEPEAPSWTSLIDYLDTARAANNTVHRHPGQATSE